MRTYFSGNNTNEKNNSDNPQLPKKDDRNQQDPEIKSIRTLTTIATIAGPVSFVVGGLLLSTIAFICALVAFIKTKKILKDNTYREQNYINTLRQTAIIGMVIGLAAIVMNAISIALVLPTLMQAMQTGDYSTILGDAALSTSSTSSSGSVWG